MLTQHKHYVTFQSPGTLFHEETTKPVKEWDPKLAIEMSEKITERHGAKPYSFYFTTQIEHLPVSDGDGGELQVQPKQTKKSGRYFLGGKVETFAEIKARNLPDESILRSNMECNDWNAVVVNTNSWKSVQPFTDDDVIVGPDGAVVEKASDYK